MVTTNDIFIQEETEGCTRPLITPLEELIPSVVCDTAPSR